MTAIMYYVLILDLKRVIIILASNIQNQMKKPNESTAKQNAVANNGQQNVRTTRRSSQKQQKVLQKSANKKKDRRGLKKAKPKRSGEIFEIQRILKVRTKPGGSNQYLVAWKGYTSHANRWVDAKYISNLSILLSKNQDIKPIEQVKQKKIKKAENIQPTVKPVNRLRSKQQFKKRQQQKKLAVKKTAIPELINLDSDEQLPQQENENQAKDNINKKQNQEIEIKGKNNNDEDSEQVEQISPPAIEPKNKNEVKGSVQQASEIKQKQKVVPSIDIEVSQQQANKINQATNENKGKPNNSRYNEEQLKILQQFYDE